MNWLSTIAESAKEALEDAAIAAAEIRATATAPDRNVLDNDYDNDDENGSEARDGDKHSPYYRYKRNDLSIATTNTSDYLSSNGKDSTSNISAKRINKVLDINISLSDDEDENSNKPLYESKARNKSPSLLNETYEIKLNDNKQENIINNAESIPINNSSDSVDVNKYNSIIKPKIVDERAASPARMTSPAGYDSDYVKALIEENETLKKKMKETTDHYENELAQTRLIAKSNQMEKQKEESQLKENELKEANDRQRGLENENETLRNKLKNYETESEKHSQSLNIHKQEIFKNQNQIKQLESDSSKQLQKISMLENEKNGILKEMEELKLHSQPGAMPIENKDGDIKAMVEKYEMQMNDLRNQIAYLEAGKNENTPQPDVELASYKQQVESLRIENESQKSDIVKANEEILNLKSSLEEITNQSNSQNSTSQKAVQEFQVQFAQMNELNEKLNQEIKTLNEEKEQNMQHIKELQIQLNANSPQQNIEAIKGELANAYEEKMEALKK